MKKGPNALSGRVMKKEQNWYLRGWEYRDVPGPNGPKRRLVYVREHYRLDLTEKRRTRVKLLAGLTYLLACGVYVGFETTMTQGGLAWYAGAPCLLAVIPLFYLGLGVWNLARAEEIFTFRRKYAVFTRLRVGGWAAAVLLGLGALGQGVFLIRYGKALELGPELWMLGGSAFDAVCAGALAVLAGRLPCVETSRSEAPAKTEKR